MGLTVRSADGWRYTEWYAWNNATLTPRWDAGPVGGVELYAHAAEDAAENATGAIDFDASENENVCDAHANVSARLSRVLRAQFDRPRRRGRAVD